MNIQSWFPLGSTCLISLLSKNTPKSLLQHHDLKAPILHCSAFFMVQLSHLYMTTGNIVTLTIWTFCLQSDVSAFQYTVKVSYSFPCTEQVSFNFMAAATIHSDLKPKKIKSVTASTFSPFICHEVMGLDGMILVFEGWVLSQLFHSPPSPSSRVSLIPLHFLPLVWYPLHLRLLIFLPAIFILACDSPSWAFHMMYSA